MSQMTTAALRAIREKVLATFDQEVVKTKECLEKLREERDPLYALLNNIEAARQQRTNGNGSK